MSQGLVLINKRIASLGDKVEAGDEVTLNGKLVKPLLSENVIVIALNKPKGIVCTAAKETVNNIVDFVGHSSRVYPIGRLDKQSQGLIFLTNKSDLVDRVNQSGNQHEKEYRVTVNKLITDQFLEGMRCGVPILGQNTKACQVVFESEYVFSIVLTQGLNRQIRRMCMHFGYSVQKLERIRIMHVSLCDLEIGQWRNLSQTEKEALFL